MEQLLFGRQLLTSEMQTLGFTAQQLANLDSKPAMYKQNDSIFCQRCQSRYPKAAVCLPSGLYYCPACIRLNRVDSNQRLYHLPEPNLFVQQMQPLTWQGTLTPAQQKISDQLIRSFRKKRRHLLWAVTGAGKTEMLFPLLALALQTGARIGVVSPRIDVCNELYPRLQQAFAKTTLQLRHGQQTRPYTYAQLTVATTHQLLRFYGAFDLLIVDEVDAFPYVNEPLLKTATTRALKPKAMLLYLTATPTPALFKLMAHKQLQTSYLPRRFHGRDLPLPELVYQSKLATDLAQHRLPKKFLMRFKQSLQKKRQILIFIPQIKWLDPIKVRLRGVVSAKIATVYGDDPDRQTKVQAFRDQQVQVLLTTTILERGVTFSNVDVFILQADDRIFTTASLVQIAGRSGRDAHFENGSVYFFYEYYTQHIKQCQKQIRYMNRKQV